MLLVAVSRPPWVDQSSTLSRLSVSIWVISCDHIALLLALMSSKELLHYRNRPSRDYFKTPQLTCRLWNERVWVLHAWLALCGSRPGVPLPPFPLPPSSGHSSGELEGGDVENTLQAPSGSLTKSKVSHKLYNLRVYVQSVQKLDLQTCHENTRELEAHFMDISAFITSIQSVT